MRVISVNISKEKGVIKKPVDSIILDKNGIAEDAHAGSWHRQVSILSIESVKRFEQQAGRKIGFGEFAENITTDGLDLTTVKLLDRIIVGDVVLEVTQIGKKCHGDGCAIYREVGKCVMPKEGIFCRVLSGGIIKPEDQIKYEPYDLKFSIITLSDRAFSGEYEDLSGKKIKELIADFYSDSHWRIALKTTIIPDDPKDLKTEFEKACNDSDIIFTTGGTGIGPKDITPDVIQPLLDIEIPGIMDFIRNKYGVDFPNALISRAVAGVKNRTLVFCLPGSVKAVTEYTEEILKTLHHSIFMVKDIKTHSPGNYTHHD